MRARALRSVLLVVCVAGAAAWFRRDLAAALSLFRGHWSFGAGAGIFALALLHFVNEPLRWWVLLGARQANVTLPRIYHGLTATALGSYLLPARLGVPMRVFMATRVLQLDVPTTSAILIGDAVYSYGTWALVALAGGVILMPDLNWLGPAAILAALCVGAGGVVAAARLDWLGSCRFAVAARLAQGLRLLSARIAVINSGLVAGDIVLYGVRHALILATLGVHCSLLNVTFVVAISIFAGFVSLMPAGFGAYDISLVFLLTLIGVPREAAVAVPVINRVVTIATGVLLGAVSVHRLGIEWREGVSGEFQANTVSVAP